MSQCKKLVQKKNLSTEAGNAMQKKSLGRRKKTILLQERKRRIKYVGYPYSLTTEEVPS